MLILGHLGYSWGHFGLSCGQLGQPGVILDHPGFILGHLKCHFGFSLDHAVVILGDPWVIYCHPWLILIIMGSFWVILGNLAVDMLLICFESESIYPSISPDLKTSLEIILSYVTWPEDCCEFINNSTTNIISHQSLLKTQSFPGPGLRKCC